MTNLIDEVLEMLQDGLKDKTRRTQIASILEPFVPFMIEIFKEQLGQYLQVFGISFIVLLVVSLVNLVLLIQSNH